MNGDIIKNSVSAKGQTKYPCIVNFGGEGAVRVLFMGNSITLHEPAHGIGWHHNHGMAASAPECDYVHRVVSALENKHGKITYCVANVAAFERGYNDKDIITSYREAKEIRPEIVIFRLGENVNRDLLDTYSLKDGLAEFFRYYAEGAREVIVTDLFWYHERICGALCEAAEELGFTLVKLSDLGECDENKALGLFEHEGIALHPGDLGMQRIAKRITDALGV